MQTSRLLTSRIDYRAVVFGALLPDLIDKPIVWFILRDSDLGGHHVGHSLVFLLATLIVGLVFVARGDQRVLLIAFGALTHIAFDSLTHIPWSILYPFVELDIRNVGFLLRATNVAGEVIALLVLFVSFRKPRARERAALFVREGSIEL